MKRSRSLGFAAAAALAVAGAGLSLAGSANADSTGSLPPHVYAPYFEMYNGDDPATLAQQSGANYLTLAFLQTASKGSCTADWNGDASTPVSSAQYGDAIASIRAAGGDVIPSFGGFTADDTGTEIADSCTDVSKIAAAYEQVITTYNVTRIDLDTEDNSLTNSAGITRRNQAIAQVEAWAAANGRNIEFQYTLPTTTNGLASSGLKVLKNAVTNDADIAVVNIMTFDYYDGASHEMANDTKSAATGLVGQLANLYPTKTNAQLWAMVGVTVMPGIDDYGAAETTTTADASTVASWATQQGIASLSIWALQRDNGGCPGTAGSDTCSGVSQSTWQFSNAFEPFTTGGGVVPPPISPPPTDPVTTPPTTPPPTNPSTCSVAAWTSGTVYTGGQQASSDGDVWTAQWWTLGEKPGSSSVWIDQGSCSGGAPTTPPPGSCTAPAWSSGAAYNGGALVSYDGDTWKAEWWTQGDTPGSSTQNVWADQGAC